MITKNKMDTYRLNAFFRLLAMVLEYIDLRNQERSKCMLELMESFNKEVLFTCCLNECGPR